MKKKIIFFAPNIEDGGIEKNIIILGNYFTSQNKEVEIIHSNISENIKKKLSKKILLTKSNINFNIPFFNKIINNSIKSFIYMLFKLNPKKFDKILSFQDHPFAIIASVIKNKKSIIRIANHPIGSLKYFNNKINFFLKLFIKIFFYQFANLIISNSRESTNFFKKYIIFKKKCITIYNPIKMIKKKNKILKKQKILISIGRLDKQKNFAMLIKAFKILLINFPSYKLIIIGKGRERKNLISIIKKNNLTKNVKILNFRDPKKYYQKAKLFILSSYFEGLPNVLLEAMNNKLPIVSSNCLSGPREILRDGKYGYLFEVDNIDDCVKKIKSALNNYNLSIKKAHKGFKSLNNISSEKQCKNYLKSLDALH